MPGNQLQGEFDRSTPLIRKEQRLDEFRITSANVFFSAAEMGIRPIDYPERAARADEHVITSEIAVVRTVPFARELFRRHPDHFLDFLFPGAKSFESSLRQREAPIASCRPISPGREVCRGRLVKASQDLSRRFWKLIVRWRFSLDVIRDHIGGSQKRSGFKEIRRYRPALSANGTESGFFNGVESDSVTDAENAVRGDYRPSVGMAYVLDHDLVGLNLTY